MTIPASLIVCIAAWFMFAFPILLFAAMHLGASLYAKGAARVLPTLGLPRFSGGRAKSNGDARQSDRVSLPEV